MKTIPLLSLPVILISLVIIVYAGKCSGKYKDGTYQGISKAIYTSENYFGITKITIRDGVIANVDFRIIDSTKREYFDEKYEKYFKGNDEYIRQCRNDWKGVQVYPQQLMKYQELKGVDAVSGATWSYNMFKYSATEALKDAKK